MCVIFFISSCYAQLGSTPVASEFRVKHAPLSKYRQYILLVYSVQYGACKASFSIHSNVTALTNHT